MKRVTTLLFICMFFVAVKAGQPDFEVRIERVSGEVKIRRGVDESWHSTSAGVWLDEVDSIVTGENGAVVLVLPDGSRFSLGARAILDIADLRKVSEQELFLYLMSRKVQEIEPHEQKTRLKVGNVHVVHGEDKTDSLLVSSEESTGEWRLLKNGARDLYRQAYYTNTILKVTKILARYPGVADCGELHLYLGRAFEALNKPGQAIDAYKIVVNKSAADSCNGSGSLDWTEEAQEALRRLNP